MGHARAGASRRAGNAWGVLAEMSLNGGMPLANRPIPASDGEAVPLPGVLIRYRAAVSSALRSSLSQDEPEVYNLLKYYMGWVDEHGYPSAGMEGKALRPTLCLFACEAVGGTSDMAMPAAVALEFIHIFSLIHDDIQDEDETRHSRKTLWKLWGVPKALVAGNVLRVVADQALHQLVHAGLEHDRALLAMGLLTEAYLEMIEGQYLDLSFEGRDDVGVGDYFQMISRKTGALIRCSMALGAAVGSERSRGCRGVPGVRDGAGVCVPNKRTMCWASGARRRGQENLSGPT